MPAKRLEFVKQPLNLSNDTTAGGFSDPITGVSVPGGGLILGDFIEITDAEAVQSSNITQGPPTAGYTLLFGGNYRRIKVDSGATAANIKVGTLAYATLGTNGVPVAAVQIKTAGSGQTAGVYTISSSGGAGTGAQILVVVGSGGTVTNAYVLNGGSGYTSVPTFTLVTGGTVGTVQAELAINTYVATDYANAYSTSLCLGVFLNAITPGNYGWIQQSGMATFLGNATIGTAAIGNYLVAASAGTVSSAATATALLTVGQAIDLPVASTLFRGVIEIPNWQP